MSLGLTDCLMGLKQSTFLLNCNPLAHEATLCGPLTTYVSNSVIRLMEKFCLSTKIVFQVFWFFFLKLKGELALAYQNYPRGILIVILIEILNDYYFYLAVACNNEPFSVMPPTSSG